MRWARLERLAAALAVAFRADLLGPCEKIIDDGDCLIDLRFSGTAHAAPDCRRELFAQDNEFPPDLGLIPAQPGPLPAVPFGDRASNRGLIADGFSASAGT